MEYSSIVAARTNILRKSLRWVRRSPIQTWNIINSHWLTTT
jgi:hypothetical protein